MQSPLIENRIFQPPHQISVPSACFGLLPNGRVVYFDGDGQPCEVGVRDWALVRGCYIEIGIASVQIISATKAYELIVAELEELETENDFPTRRRWSVAGLSQVQANSPLRGERSHSYLQPEWLWPQASQRLSKKPNSWSRGLGGLVVLVVVIGVFLLVVMSHFLRPIAPAPEYGALPLGSNGIASSSSKAVVVVKADKNNSNAYNPLGPVTISRQVFRDFLAEMSSPALPEADSMYDACATNGCDPAVMAAFFSHESSGGKYGAANVTRSVGNIRCSAGYACYNTGSNGSFRQYASWTEGARDWVRLLTFYRDGWKLSTLEEIIPRYAPASDHNDEKMYILTVKQTVDKLRAQEVQNQAALVTVGKGQAAGGH